MKKFLIGSLTAFVVVWSIGIASFVAVPNASAAVGDLVKAAGDSTVYVVSGDGVTICQFPHANVYSSWGYPADFSSVMTKDLSTYTTGANVEFRDASLVKGDGSAVYMVYNQMKRPIVSETVFLALGYDWDEITWLSDAFLADYTTGADVDSSATHPDGQIIKYASSPAVYLIDGGMKRAFQSASAFEDNRFSWGSIITIPDTETYADGAAVTAYESGLSLPVCIGSTVATTNGDLTVTLSPLNPGATTIVAGGNNLGGQMLIPFLAINFTASTSGDAQVNNLKFKRKGISADSDLFNSYLYDGNMTRLAFGGSLSSNVLTFNDPTGLFTVPAGTTKTVYLYGDLDEDTDAGKTIGFDLESASMVTTAGGSVSGSFPASGNLMTTAVASDLGRITLSNFTSAAPASSDLSIDPDQQELQVWSGNIQATNQDLSLRGMRFTEVGSIQKDDLANFKLYLGGSLVSEVASMNADNEVFFDLSASPYEMIKGQSKALSLRADIVKGSTRTFYFSFQYQDDILVWDKNYNVYAPTFISDSWTIIKPAGNYKVSSGTMTVTRNSSSPTGNVALDATNVHVASFDFKATGEDVKVNSLLISADTNVASAGLDNCKILLDGVQVGSTTDCPEFGATPATVTFGSSFIAQAGVTHVVDIYADMKEADGTSFTNADTVTVYLEDGTTNAQGKSSLTTINLPSANTEGNQLSITSGALTITKYAGYGDQTMVAGTNGALVGSAIFTAGSSEGVNVNSLTIALSSAEAGSTTNLVVKKDGVELATAKANPSTSNLYSVNFDIPASGSVIIEVYTDFKSGAANGTWTANIDATASGLVTGNAPSVAAKDLQDISLSTGSLTAASAASKPDADIVIAGATKQHMNAIEFSALYEDFEVQEFTVTTTAAFADELGKVYLDYPTNGGTGQAEGYISGTSVTFTGLNMYVPRDDTAVLNIYADLTTIANGADSGDAEGLDFAVGSTYKHVGLGSGDVTTSGTSVSSANLEGNHMVVRETRPTVTLVALPSTTLAIGTMTISKFTVSADAAGPLSINELNWDVATTSSTTIASAALYDSASPSTALTASGTPAITGTTIRYVLATPVQIAAGSSKTFYLNVAVTGTLSTDDSIITRLASPASTATGTYGSIVASSGKFIWSDHSATPHTAASADFATAQYVKTLPSDYQTLTK